jgi:hypothetical protein
MLRYGPAAVRRIFDASSECGSRQYQRADKTPPSGCSKTRSMRPRSRRCGRRPLRTHEEVPVSPPRRPCRSRDRAQRYRNAAERAFARPRPFSTRRITHSCRIHPCRQPMPLRLPWRGRGQGEGEYDCGFHSIFFQRDGGIPSLSIACIRRSNSSISSHSKALSAPSNFR